MPKPKNAMEIFQLLDKSNCQKCGKKTCLAFAGAVFMGQKALADCPKLDRETVELYSGERKSSHGIQQYGDEYLENLKNEISKFDLAALAQRAGARFCGDRLTLKVLGKDFTVDSAGNFSTDIHINPWVAVPLLNYVLYGKGIMASGKWVSFRELKNGKEQYPLFQKRCERPMKQVADAYTQLFDDMVHIFNGKPVEKQFESDISVVLHPLPKVPVMICYWSPEDGLESSLNVFFDETASDNLDIGSIFSLGTGLSQMFEKLSQRHGFRRFAAPRPGERNDSVS